MKTFISNRLGERSSWNGLVLLLSLLGVSLSPEQAEAITVVGIAIYGIVEVFLPDIIKK